MFTGKRKMLLPMQDEPDLDRGLIAATVASNYGLAVTDIRFLPIGYDANASVYEVSTEGDESYFLKVRSGSFDAAALEVPRALIDHGVKNILAPIRSKAATLSCPLDSYSLALYPFVRGQDASDVGMSDSQWVEFGEALRQVHDSHLTTGFSCPLRVETFELPSVKLVREMQDLISGTEFRDPAARQFAAFWLENSAVIENFLRAGQALGETLRSREFEHVLCHSDIHAANIVVGEDGRIWLADWDAPIVAPRERDLIFVVGSKIARDVEPREEELFFQGYGPWEVDRDLLRYYRLERLIEDVGDFGRSVFLDDKISEETRQSYVDLVTSFFHPGGYLDHCLEGG